MVQLSDGQHDNFLSLLYFCPYVSIETYDWSKITSTKIISMLDNHYGIILPINTKLLGISEKPFYHNVFLYGSCDGKINVYDFWAPTFKWGDKLFQPESIVNAISKNSMLDRSAYSIKIKTELFDSKYTLLSLYRVIENYLANNSKNNQSNAIYGIDVYDCICKYIMELKEIYYLDHTIFHNLGEHFEVIRLSLTLIEEYKHLYTYNIKKEIDELKQLSYFVKTLSMKYWRQQHIETTNWKANIINHVLQIKQKEINLLVQINHRIESELKK